MIDWLARRFGQEHDEEKTESETRAPASGVMDEGARDILKALENAGFEAYCVGGCVRDLLLGMVPHDWDITTSARPEDILSAAEKNGWRAIDGGGRRFGTVIVVHHGTGYEVTTFRRDCYGSDSHRPQQVTFSDTLKDDVSRRDFTINAMALGLDGVIYDYFGGEEDLSARRLVTVGDGAKRFQEDALRLFRACRMLGKLNFMADDSLVAGMAAAFPRVRGLSLARVRDEVDRLLLTPHAARGLDLMVRTGLNACACQGKESGVERAVPILPELSHLVGLPQMKEFHAFDGWYHTLAVVDASPRTLITRWAALLHDVGKGLPGVREIHGNRITDHNHDQVGGDIAEHIMNRWERSEKFGRRVAWIVRNHMRYHYFANNPSANPKKWIRQMARSGEYPSSKEMAEAMQQMNDVCVADIIGCGRSMEATLGHKEFGRYMNDLVFMMPVTTKELHYDKRTLAALQGHMAGGMGNLLLRVQNGGLENTPEALYQAAVRYARRHEGRADAAAK